MITSKKYAVAFLVIISIVYVYRANNHNDDFVSQIPSDVNICVDNEIDKLLSSNVSDNDLVESALSSCSYVVDPWLKSITITDGDYGMTMSYLKEHYTSEIKYSRQPETGG
ncbi:hypothetical protein [Enterobacter soli]|uniref:Uncharacterized protein n=1 Tax=Enterobacter soli TaxID=885040 RepID=A0AAW8H6F2_9ENTR|nr:hypothetical protein [Enterobacter soli]MDQ2256411.1 hypothetical protein [Enterobacter soli]MDQ2339059.1 hypothetical protein [Enterobacter soli]